MSQIQILLEKIDKLPNSFTVGVKIAKMLDDPDVKVNDLANLISTDHGLTSQLLKLCNSAQYGFSKKISTINDAIPKLGFKTLKSIIFLLISESTLHQEVKGYNLEKNDLWENSISCAVYSRHLARIKKYADPDTAFTAGLLRDMGKLIIHEHIGITYDRIVNYVNTNMVSFSEAEEVLLGFNHCDIGAKAAKKWNFPDILTDAIKYHHSPTEGYKNGCSDLKLISIVHIADFITMMTGTGMGNDGMMYKADMKALEILNIPAESAEVENLISNMIELKPEIDEMVGIANAK